MLHWYCKVTIILRKRKNAKETIIMRRWEYHCGQRQLTAAGYPNDS